VKRRRRGRQRSFRLRRIFLEQLVDFLDGLPEEFDLMIDDFFRLGGRRWWRNNVFVDIDIIRVPNINVFV
jgi:hypothetical protein